MLFTSVEQSLLTSGVSHPDQWQELSGPENLVGSVPDGRYIGFFSGTNQGFILTRAQGRVVCVELPGARFMPLQKLSRRQRRLCSFAVGMDIEAVEGGEFCRTWRSLRSSASAGFISMSARRCGGQNRAIW